MKPILSATTLALVLAACSPTADETTQNREAAAVNDTADPAAQFTPPAAPTEAAVPVVIAAPGKEVLTLEGLGPLRIGQALPASGGWKQDPTCSAAASPTYPGVYAIVEQGKVRRITVHAASEVKLTEGIGVGSSESAVTAAFPGFRSEPHKYEAKPAKYLTAPNAKKGDVALRFEIGPDGKVQAMHVGTMPALAYVEGCG